MKRPVFQFKKYRLDVQKNEKEVLEFLHSIKIYERGQITSPKKEVWFKFCHYIRIMPIFTMNGNWFAYTYISKDEKYEGEVLQDLSFIDLRHLFV